MRFGDAMERRRAARQLARPVQPPPPPVGRAALKAYEESGGVPFYLLANGDAVIGVRYGDVSTLTFRDYRVIARLGPLKGSRAELLNGPQGPVAVITFADGAHYYSRAITASGIREAAEEVAQFNKLAGYRPGPVGYVPADRKPVRQDPPSAVWSCRFCQTSNRDRRRCDHCGAPRPFQQRSS